MNYFINIFFLYNETTIKNTDKKFKTFIQNFIKDSWTPMS